MKITTLLTVCCLCFAAAAHAQSDRGTITGIVTDPDGAAIPGVTVAAENPETGVTFDTVTTGTGNYTISGLPSGSYSVRIELSGFGPFRQNGVRVFVGQTARIDAKLVLGGITEETTVTADASMLDTQSGDLSTSVTVENLNELPLNFGARGNFASAAIRNPYSFITLVPGGNISSYSSLKLNGAPVNSFQIRIEGMESNNHRIQSRVDQVQPSVESLEEMTVHTSNFAAEYGQVAGGVFNLTAKAGTNRITGSLFDYYVNEKLFYGGLPYTDDGTGKKVVPRNRRSNFGGSIGGPIVIPGVYDGHNKSFFFFTVERFNERATRSGLLSTMPTDLMRSGDFSEALTGRVLGVDPLGRNIMENAIYDPRTSRAAPNGQIVRDPFPGNRIPTELLDPVALKVQALIPRATRPGLLTNNWDQSFPADTIKTVVTIKADHNIERARGKLSFYYSQYGGPHYNGSDGLPVPITAVRLFETQTDTIRVSYDWSMTPTTFVTFKGGHIRHWNPDLGLKEVLEYDPIGGLGLVGAVNGKGFPQIGSMFTATGGGFPFSMVRTGAIPQTHKPSFLANVTHARNTHTYKTGFEWRNDIFGEPGIFNTHGNYNFNAQQTGLPSTQTQTLAGGGTVGLPYASFLMGRVNSATIASPTDAFWIKPSASAFIQDTWRLNGKLTLDYGLRWDYQGFPREREYRRGMFSADTPNPTAGGLPGATIYEGNGPGGCQCDFVETYRWNFGPRLGLAYQLNAKTVLRGGWGLTYAQTNSSTSDGGGQLGAGGWNSINYTNQAFGEPALLFRNGLTYDRDALFAVQNNAGIRPSTPAAIDNPTNPIHPDAGRPPKMYQWNVSMQREITKNMVVDVAYVGNRGSGFAYNGTAEGQLNSLTPERLASFGLDPANNANDRTLLRARIDSATAIARGFSRVPYVGYSTANTVAQALRPFPQFGNIGYTAAPFGRTKYDSLQVKATQRYARGLNLTATFTYQNERNNNGIDNPYGDPDDFWTIAGNSEPLITVLAFSYELPGFGNQLTRGILGGWTVGGLVRYASGAPIPVPAATTNLNQLFFMGNSRMIRVPGEPLFSNDLNGDFDAERDFVLNPKAWVNPEQGQFGNQPQYYDDFRYQRRPEEQLSFGRVFRVGDRKAFSLRAELFNVFNRPDLNNPVSTNPGATQTRNADGKTSAGFGFIDRGSVFGPPRAGQLVARLSF